MNLLQIMWSTAAFMNCINIGLAVSTGNWHAAFGWGSALICAVVIITLHTDS